MLSLDNEKPTPKDQVIQGIKDCLQRHEEEIIDLHDKIGKLELEIRGLKESPSRFG